ncbi:MAG: peptidylprolyl isomerase [Acidimicrobiia bacterium]|nr:peptidylprolyl isomerase [Acidimicrobiia bacterium]
MSKAAKRERQRLNRETARQAREAAQRRSRQRRTLRNVLIFAVIGVVVFVLFAVLGDDDEGDESSATTTTVASTTTSASSALPAGCREVEAPAPKDVSFPEPPAMEIDPAGTYTARMQTTCGEIAIALDAATAPQSVNNFVFLARQGFYDGLAFVRSAAGFVVQAGSPTQDNAGGPGYSLQGEVPADGYELGSVAMAKGGSEAPGTAGSQFFIVTSPDGPAKLTPDYAVVGTVTEGLEVAQTIESLAPPSGDGPPTRPVVIERVTIEES